MGHTARLVVMAGFAALCLTGGQRTTVAAGLQSVEAPRRTGSGTLSLCPPQQEINAALGKASSLLQQAQYKDAAEVLETFSIAKCDARTYLLLAAAHEASGDLTKAEDTLQRAHAFWPSNTSIAASLAREYLSEKQVDKAVAALGAFHVTVTTPLQEMQEGVVVYIAAHRLVPALALAETAYKSYPALNTLLLLANVLQLQGRYKDVNRLLQDQRKTYEGSPAFLITFAESENDALLWEAARDDLKRAIALDDKSYQAHYLLGTVLGAQNQVDQAESEYRTAIELAPNQPRAYYQLALLLHTKQDDVDEAALLTQALEADDHYAPAYCEMGRILMDQHHLAEAANQLNLAIQYNPQFEQAYFLLARVDAALGKRDEADAMVKRYTELRTANRRTSVDRRPGQIGVNQETQ
jgi:tetratricopeptide (TPR) repeat protein